MAGLVARNTATAIGRTIAATERRAPRLVEASSIAGSDASEDCVLIATACAGATARAKPISETCPATIASGYAATSTTKPIEETMMI